MESPSPVVSSCPVAVGLGDTGDSTGAGLHPIWGECKHPAGNALLPPLAPSAPAASQRGLG